MKRYNRRSSFLTLRQVLKGIKLGITNKTTRAPRLPITPHNLLVIRNNLYKFIKHKHDGHMIWCASTMAYYGFLRVSEYTNPHPNKYKKASRTLTAADVQKDGDIIQIQIKQSKTDTAKHGTSIQIGSNYTKICPVKAFIGYTKLRGLSDGPFFRWHNGRFLTPVDMNKILKQILENDKLGVYSSLSFRIGAASAAAASGYPHYVIQQIGRWSSDCYLKYIRISRNLAKQVSHSLAHA